MLSLRHWFNPAAETCEAALCDMPSLCRLVGVALGRKRAPDGPTLFRFLRLLEEKDLGKQLFAKGHNKHPLPDLRMRHRAVGEKQCAAKLICSRKAFSSSVVCSPSRNGGIPGGLFVSSHRPSRS